MTDNFENVAPDKVPALYIGEVSAEPPNLLGRLQESKAVRIVADRLELTDVGKVKANHTERLMVAQAAIGTGLTPYPPQPELYWWIAVKNGQRILTMMRGRDGTRRLAEENARRNGTYLLDPKFELVLEETKKVSMGFKADDLVVLARVSNKREVDDWYKRRRDLKDEGLSTEDIDKRIGALEPCGEGYGRITQAEMKDLDKYKDNMMPHINRCRKRAVTEAVKPWASQMSVSDLAASSSTDIDKYIVEAEWREVQDERSPEQVKKDADEGAATLYDPPPTSKPEPVKPKPWPKATLKAMVEANAAADTDHAAEMLGHSAFDRNVAKTPAVAYAKAYQGAIESGETPKKAGEIGTAEYLDGLKRRRESQ